MLRIYFLQHWFNLSDLAVEEAVYDSQAMRRFVGIDLGHEPVPDETTVCRFCNLLETHDRRRLFDEVQRPLVTPGCGWRPVRLSMQSSLMHRPRPKIAPRRATLRCSRPKRAITGISV